MSCGVAALVWMRYSRLPSWVEEMWTKVLTEVRVVIRFENRSRQQAADCSLEAKATPNEATARRRLAGTGDL